jgi:hypothetical protein
MRPALNQESAVTQEMALKALIIDKAYQAQAHSYAKQASPASKCCTYEVFANYRLPACWLWPVQARILSYSELTLTKPANVQHRKRLGIKQPKLMVNSYLPSM